MPAYLKHDLLNERLENQNDEELRLIDIFADYVQDGKLYIQGFPFYKYGQLLENIDFSDCVFEHCDFSYLHLEECYFNTTIFNNCIQYGATIRDTIFENCMLDGAHVEWIRPVSIEIISLEESLGLRNNHEYGDWFEFMMAHHPEHALKYDNLVQGGIGDLRDTFYVIENEKLGKDIKEKNNATFISNGWKLHISVDQKKIKHAFDIIAPTLYEHFPIFKVLDIEIIENADFDESHRLIVGGQFTIYLLENRNGEPMVDLEKLNEIIRLVCEKLEAADIKPGKVPDSDQHLNNNYFSIRNSYLFGGLEDYTPDGVNNIYIRGSLAGSNYNPGNRPNPYQSLQRKPVPFDIKAHFESFYIIYEDEHENIPVEYNRFLKNALNATIVSVARAQFADSVIYDEVFFQQLYSVLMEGFITDKIVGANLNDKKIFKTDEAYKIIRDLYLVYYVTTGPGYDSNYYEVPYKFLLTNSYVHPQVSIMLEALEAVLRQIIQLEIERLKEVENIKVSAQKIRIKHRLEDDYNELYTAAMHHRAFFFEARTFVKLPIELRSLIIRIFSDSFCMKLVKDDVSYHESYIKTFKEIYLLDFTKPQSITDEKFKQLEVILIRAFKAGNDIAGAELAYLYSPCINNADYQAIKPNLELCLYYLRKISDSPVSNVSDRCQELYRQLEELNVIDSNGVIQSSEIVKNENGYRVKVLQQNDLNKAEVSVVTLLSLSKTGSPIHTTTNEQVEDRDVNMDSDLEPGNMELHHI